MGRAEEDEGGGVVGETDPHSPLVTRGPAHTCLHILDINIPVMVNKHYHYEHLIYIHTYEGGIYVYLPDFVCELRPDKHVETNAYELMEGHKTVFARLLVQGLPQLQGPLLGVLLAGIHDVLGVKVDHLLKSNCINVNLFFFPILARFVNVNKGWNLNVCTTYFLAKIKTTIQLLKLVILL